MQEGGRINQKARTRATLLMAAQQMIREGKQPSVEEVAQATGISKRTAYRYFSSREHLLADAALEGLRPKMAAVLDTLSGHDVGDRVKSLAEALHELTVAYEAELRTIARAGLDASLMPKDEQLPQSRGARRIEWITEALKPIRSQLSKTAYERLVSGLCVCVGIDSFVVLRDICGLADNDIKNVVLWMCRTMLDGTMAQNPTRR